MRLIYSLPNVMFQGLFRYAFRIYKTYFGFHFFSDSKPDQSGIPQGSDHSLEME